WTIGNEKYSQITTGPDYLEICGDRGDLLTISVNAPIRTASWIGEDILVKLESGETRQYLNTRHYLILPEPQKARVGVFFKLLLGKFSHRLQQNISRPSGEFQLNPPAGITP
ncbi:MAG: hypothetical protein KGM98_01165, partial [Bacteroidota bacterium]|nr:hypothetical protein [Bacteroidota bacterium]